MLWWTLRKLHAWAPHTRATAAEVLGYSRDQRAVPPLMAALQDDHAAMRARGSASRRNETMCALCQPTQGRGSTLQAQLGCGRMSRVSQDIPKSLWRPVVRRRSRRLSAMTGR
jgi:hypothetical protein